MRAFLSLAACAVGLVACLDDPVEDDLSSHSAAVGPEPEWTVTSGAEACDAHLRNACPRAAVACLGNAECKALATCVRECTGREKTDVHDGDRGGARELSDNVAGDGDCVAQCGRDHRAPWRLYDPFNECATKNDACR